jgi:NADH dehydrogenase FAD-containing subunit
MVGVGIDHDRVVDCGLMGGLSPVADHDSDPADRMRLLTFVICCAGPTGVELAGAIADLAHFGLSDEFRSIDPTSARVVLVQAGPRVLPTFPENLSLAAQTSLEKMGVEVRLDSRMKKVDADGVLVNGEAISAGTTLWAAGVVASPVAQWLGQEPDSAGRLQASARRGVLGHRRCREVINWFGAATRRTDKGATEMALCVVTGTHRR